MSVSRERHIGGLGGCCAANRLVASCYSLPHVSSCQSSQDAAGSLLANLHASACQPDAVTFNSLAKAGVLASRYENVSKPPISFHDLDERQKRPRKQGEGVFCTLNFAGRQLTDSLQHGVLWCVRPSRMPTTGVPLPTSLSSSTPRTGAQRLSPSLGYPCETIDMYSQGALISSLGRGCPRVSGLLAWSHCRQCSVLA